MRRWSHQELQILRERYPREETKRISRFLGRTQSSVWQMASNLGLQKTAQYMREHVWNIDADTGRAHRFTKGHSTWNKGKRHAPKGSQRSQFREGNMPQTWLPVGTEIVNPDGVLVRKVSDTRVKRKDWRPVHVLIWEELHGPVPEDSIIVFADRDRRNFSPGNLLCITRAENMRRNSVHRYPKDVALAIQARGALNRQIRAREQRENQG